MLLDEEASIELASFTFLKVGRAAGVAPRGAETVENNLKQKVGQCNTKLVETRKGEPKQEQASVKRLRFSVHLIEQTRQECTT